jgi:hypothetical protein
MLLYRGLEKHIGYTEYIEAAKSPVGAHFYSCTVAFLKLRANIPDPRVNIPDPRVNLSQDIILFPRIRQAATGIDLRKQTSTAKGDRPRRPPPLKCMGEE